MSDTQDIGDRHLRSADGLAEQIQGGPQLVRIVASSVWAESVAGQLLISCLVNLLCRQVGVVRRIEIVSPEAPLGIWLPSGEAQFPAALVTLAHWAVADRVVVSTIATEEIADCVVLICDVVSSPGRAYTLAAIGEGWRAWIGDPLSATRSVKPRSANPLGPFLAATLVAGEVFKRGRGITRGRYLEADGYSLWSGDAGKSWEDLLDGPDIEGRSLPPLHMIGAGAVGNDFAYILASAMLAEAYVVLIDDDRYDSTSLNRCLLAGWEDEGEKKVLAVTAALKSAGLESFPFPGTLRNYLSNVPAGLRGDVAASVSQLDFGITLSCVDKGTSRQDVQGLWPKSLFGASTLNLTARTNAYSLRAGAACLACHNPPERDGDRLRAIEKQLRSMSPEGRAQFCTTHGMDVNHVSEYLSGAQCGGLGGIALKDFATKPPIEFSVGFVSMGAALLLGATLFRRVIFTGVMPARDDMTTLNYLNGGMMDANLCSDEKCEKRCQDRR